MHCPVWAEKLEVSQIKKVMVLVLSFFCFCNHNSLSGEELASLKFSQSIFPYKFTKNGYNGN